MRWFLGCISLILTIFSEVEAASSSRNVAWTTKTSHFFSKIGEWELVTVSHKQLHFIDDHHKPLYPPNAVIEFRAHDTDFKLLLRQNHELFGDRFEVTNLNASGQIEVVEWDHMANKCFYHGDVVVNGTLSNARPTLAGLHMSTCKGSGIRGSFHIAGETFTIEPAKVHIDPVEYDRFEHRIDHEHIVYKESSLHHSARPPPAYCGHGHPTNPNIVEIEHDHDHDHDHSHVANRKLLQSQPTRYVELLVVNDPARCSRFGNPPSDGLLTNTINIVNGVTARYRGTTWADSVGVVQVVLTSVQNWVGSFPAGVAPSIVNKAPLGSTAPETQASCGNCYEQAIFQDRGNNAYEISYSSYLSAWQSWRSSGQGVPEHDNGHLFSSYDFYSSVIGYASIPGMCIPSQSGGINQMTYSDNYNSAVVAHEMGHNFNMQHDSIGNTCSERGDIMAAVGDTSTAPGSFSSCSVTYLNTFFQSQSTVCLNNEPTTATYATCRNGFKEQGEFCDCGNTDCTTVDPCCDGSLCQLFANAECSSLDGCCDSTCKLKANGTLCRAKDPKNECDMAEERCAGSSECPPDLFHVEGTVCQPQGTTQTSQKGMCYQQQCISWNQQCSASGQSLQNNRAPWTSCRSSNSYFTGNLGSGNTGCRTLQCESSGSSVCEPVDPNRLVKFVAGTPCGTSETDIKQCKNSECKPSQDILSVRWIAFSWEKCSKPCRQKNDPEPGGQTRRVICAYQNGTAVDSQRCVNEKLEQPISNQTCNNFLCNFCRDTQPGVAKCAPNGVCDGVNQKCICNPGFSGENCDVKPFLNFTGITARSFSQHVPCSENSTAQVNVANFTNCNTTCQEQLSTKTASITSFAFLGNATINGTNGTQSTVVKCRCEVFFPKILQTITDRVDPSGNLSIAEPTCQIVTRKHPGYISLDNSSLNLAFYRGEYLTLRWRSQGSIDKVAVTFENLNDPKFPGWVWNHYVSSELATNVDCNGTDPNIQNFACDDFRFQIPDTIRPGSYRILVKFNNEKTNHDYSQKIEIRCSNERCNSAGHGRCDNTTSEVCTCDPGWKGTLCDQSNCQEWSFQTLGSDAFAGVTRVPQCSHQSSNCSIAGLVGKTPARCTCSNHYTGPFCELPIDGCKSYTAQSTCNADSLCTWANSACVYTTCNGLNSTECAMGAAQSQCTYDLTTNKCVRQTCSVNGTNVAANLTLAPCQESSIRRAVSASKSICENDGWYCDCSITPNVSQFIASANPGSFSSGRPKTELLTCQTCTLNCTSGSVKDTKCTRCDMCDSNLYRGVNCDQLYWIGRFDINIPHSKVTGFNEKEFNALMIQDLAFVFGFDISRIGIWQVKPSGGGTTVFFTISWLTTDRTAAQSAGGFRMKAFGKLVAQSTSVMYRGTVSNDTISSKKFEFCLPYFEECDPTRQAPFITILLICAGSSFGFMILVIVIYRLATRKRRQRRYEQKVRDVKNAQLKLMDMHHHRAKRVGMKDVSKSRARKISRARHQQQHEEQKQRKEEEKRIRRMSKEKDDANGANHNRSNSGMQLAEIRESELAPGAEEAGPGWGGEGVGGGVGEGAPMAFNAPQVMHDPNIVPPPWKTYFNQQNIPYYHNPETGITTWIHPSESGGF